MPIVNDNQTPGKLPQGLLEDVSWKAFDSRLRSKPEAFGFFSTVRRMDAAFGRFRIPRIGHSKSRADDLVHFGQRPFLHFAPRDLESWNSEPGLADSQFSRPTLYGFFFGMFGPHGPLPLHLSEWALERERAGDRAFSDFANVFTHRFLCLYYRAWAEPRFDVDMDRPRESRSRYFLGCLTGEVRPKPEPARKAGESKKPEEASTESLVAAFEAARIYFGGHFGAGSRHAEGLLAILGSVLGVDVGLESLVGRWIDVPKGCETRLGVAGSATLGDTAAMGSRFFDCQGSCRLRFGPVDLPKFQSLLPGSAGAAAVKSLVSGYLGKDLIWDVQLVLDATHVPPAVLGKPPKGSPPSGSRLGFDTFLASRKPEKNVETVIFNLEQRN